jgi:hypothetical protein
MNYYPFGKYQEVARLLQQSLAKDGVGYVIMVAGKANVRIQLSINNTTLPQVTITMGESQWITLISRLEGIAFVRARWYDSKATQAKLIA